MTFTEAQLSVAMKHGYKNWSNMIHAYAGQHTLDIDKRCEEAAELYAKHKAIEFGIELTKRGFEPCGIDKWSAVYGPADDEKEFTTEELYNTFNQK